MRNFFICLISLFFTVSINAQAPFRFFEHFGGTGDDIGYDIKQTLDSGYVITGITSSFGYGNTDVYLAKLDKMGIMKWQTTCGNYNNDVGKSVVQLSDSSYVVAGYTNSAGFGGYDVYVVKVDKMGNLLWQKQYGGTDWDFAYSMQATTDGGFIICGTTYSYGRGSADGYVIKLDGNGSLQWSKTYGGSNDDEFKSVIQTADGGYALAGYTKSYNDVNGDAWIFKLNATGDSLNSFSYNLGVYDVYNEIYELPNGEYLLAGEAYITNFRRGIFNKISSSLNNLVINAPYPELFDTDPYNMTFYSVKPSNSSYGTYVVSGVSDEGGGNTSLKTMLLDNGGWYITGGAKGSTSKDDVGYKLITTNDKSKGYAAIGYTEGYNSVLKDCFIIKYDSLRYDSLLNFDENSSSNISHVPNLDINSEIEVYPTAVSDRLLINSTSNITPQTLEISSINGNVVLRQELKNNEKENIITIPSYISSGMYILTITTKEGYLYSKKIIKE